MRNTRTKRLTTFFSLMALLGSLLVASTAGAAGPFVQDIGKLDLELSDASGDQFVYTSPAGGTVIGTQTLTQSQCKIGGNENLVDLGAGAIAANPTPLPGIKDHVIGVKAKGEGNGEPCARINNADDQMLTMTLTGSNFVNKFIHGAQFGVKLKFGATARVELWKNGSMVPGAFGIASCFGGSDCGPDSGADRLLLELPASDGDGTEYIGDTLVFKVTAPASGAFGILDDPAAGFDSFITIAEEFDGILDCGDTTDPISSTEVATNGEFWRIGNEGGAVCDPKPFNADVDETAAGVVTFSPAPATGQDDAYYVGEITSRRMSPSSQHRNLQYDADGGADSFVDMEWCTIVENLDTDNSNVPDQWTQVIASAGDMQRANLLAFAGDDPNTAKIEFYPELPDGMEPPGTGDETWCLVHSDSRAKAGDVVVTVFDIYGYGDPNFF